MKKFVLAFMLLLLLAGCDAAKLTGAKQEESSLPDISSVPASISQAESSQAGAGASSNIPAESSAPASSEPSAPATSESSAPASSGSSVSSSSETAEAPGGEEEGYDASEAVQVESVDGGIKVTFKQMPQTARDLQALLEVYPQSDARNAGAFFIASLVRYLDSTDDGHEMIDLLRGPRPMNDMDKDFLKDRLREKSYLPGAYFEGATPENDYTPDTPWSLLVYDDPMNAEEGYLYIQVATTGADSRRRITLREKDGQYYLWEYSNVLTGIRLPASQDPWL